MYTAQEQAVIREDVFRWLDAQLRLGASEISRQTLQNYVFEGERIPLLDTARGIRNPRGFDATLSIMTGVKGTYEDKIHPDGFVHYSYQSRDGGDNVKLKRAHELGVPLVYFHGIRPGAYVPFYPAYVVADDVANRTFLVALDESMRFFTNPLSPSENERRYAQRQVLQRLHQPLFRARVLHAYENVCAVCQLKLPPLLDAAHIIPDSDADGHAGVTNGLSLCKIHHAAYDDNILGITPDHEVRINADLMLQKDGPMLEYGLQGMHRRPLTLPRRRADQPSREALARRWEEFSR